LLNWEDYKSATAGVPNGAIMQIWRRVGAYDFEPDNCETGIPDGVGYTLVAETGIDSVNSFLDTNDGDGLDAGAEYCYRLVAIFPGPTGGESYVSQEVCVQMALDVPVITNVDITETSENSGEIFVRWTNPLEIDPILFPPPYYYRLFRAEGFDGNANIVEVPLDNAMDTTVVDAGLRSEEHTSELQSREK